MPTCAPEMDDVWPHRRLPELMESAAVVERTRYSESVLSGWATRRYGCEYDMEVGFERVGLLVVVDRESSREGPGKGDEERVDGDEEEW